MTQRTPVFSLEMAYLPSKNDARKIGASAIAAAGFNKQWREKGREAALTRAEALGLPLMLQSYTIKTKTLILAHQPPAKTKAGKRRKLKQWTYETSTAYRAALITPLLTKCSLVLKVWRPDCTVWDITNPWLGPVLDGFVDAGVLLKDDCFHLIRYTVEMMGVDASLKLTPHEKAQAKATQGLRLKRARYLFEFYDET